MKPASTAVARWTKDRSTFSGYKFTVTNRNDPAVLTLKKLVKEENKDRYIKEHRQRVRLMGRGPRAMWARAEGKHPRAYDSYIPLDKATHYDVYINSAYVPYNA